jgi:hypothetical protein
VVWPNVFAPVYPPITQKKKKKKKRERERH